MGVICKQMNREQWLRPARRMLLAAACAVLFAVLASGAVAWPTAADGDHVYLHLRVASFDPLSESPLGAASAPVEAPREGRQPIIVQFGGPISDEWRRQVAATGAAIIEYVPDYAYLVLADQEQRSRLAALPAVRWLGYLQPAYRIEPALLMSQGAVTVTISLFPSTAGSSVDEAVRSSGGRLVQAGSATGAGSVRASLPASRLASLAALPGVAWIEQYRAPRLWNDVARGIVDVAPVWTSHDLRGQGQTIAIADTGLDTGDGQSLNADFRGRIAAAFGLGRDSVWSDPDGHGTHVAGTAAGNGLNSAGDPAAGQYEASRAGIAPEARLVIQSLLDEHGGLGGLPGDLMTLLQQAYDAGARVHNNSWGVAAADGGRVYDSQAQQVDRFTWQHPDMVVVLAAGNDGEDEDRDGVVDDGSITTPATAKNGISVGASESVRSAGGYTAGGLCGTWGECWPDQFAAPPLSDDALSNNAGGMAAFSSRGPAPDGRLKPDLVAPGTNIISARSALARVEGYWGVYDEFYAYSGGTSMAAPLVAGAAALTRQFYEQQGTTASAALVKATLLAGATDLTPGQYAGTIEMAAAPDNVQGWGRLDIGDALFPAAPRSLSAVDEQNGVTTGQSMVYTYTVASPETPLRVVLVWTDYPGSLMARSNIVNDLDLQVIGPLGAQVVENVAADRLNNVEGFTLDSPAAGVYRVIVRGYNVPFGPQPFALVVSADMQEPAPPPAVIVEASATFGEPGATVGVQWRITGGDVVTATALLWDTESHASDGEYAHTLAPATTGRQHAATVRLPASGALYVAAQGWVDGVSYLSDERVIEVVATTYRMSLPLILTYPAAAPTPTPQVTKTPATVVQLIQNGSFEDAAPQSPPWRQYDRADPAGLLVSDFRARTGLWSAWLGGLHNGFQRIDQLITPPAGATHAMLVFHWYMDTEDDASVAHDVMTARLLNAAGAPIMTILQRDNTSTRGAWVTTRYTWNGDFPYGGQSVRLSFEMTTDGAKYTNLDIDDVTFFFSGGPIAGADQGQTDSVWR